MLRSKGKVSVGDDLSAATGGKRTTEITIHSRGGLWFRHKGHWFPVCSERPETQRSFQTCEIQPEYFNYLDLPPASRHTETHQSKSKNSMCFSHVSLFCTSKKEFHNSQSHWSKGIYKYQHMVHLSAFVNAINYFSLVMSRDY